ncbi:HAD family hydrolase [Microbacterium aurantiacum]|uniref:HAD family hydrolase n=1 Tax=Microbacterium aurantiacum TaxID=162393 RepID=UPI003D73D02F
MTAHFDAVVFDCDGVLVDSELLSMRMSQRLLRDVGWDADIDELMATFTGCSREFFDAEVERRIGRPLEPGWDAAYSGWLAEAFESELTAVPGIAPALERIGLPVAVASNSGHDRIRMSLDLVGLLPRFDGRIASAEDVAAGKPEPDVYLRAADMLGVAPERCIAIDDSVFGVEAARRAGMLVLAYRPDAVTAAVDRVLPIDDLHRLPEVVDRLAREGVPSSA